LEKGSFREVGMKSISIIEIAYIEKEAFMKVLVNHQREFEKFYQLKDQIMIYRDPDALRMKCQNCGSNKHFL
jgi:hypothetical protein